MHMCELVWGELFTFVKEKMGSEKTPPLDITVHWVGRRRRVPFRICCVKRVCVPRWHPSGALIIEYKEGGTGNSSRLKEM
jgi:hypothetical protein